MLKIVENAKNNKLVVLYKWITRNKSKKIKENTINPTNDMIRRWEINRCNDNPQFWYGENDTN